MPSETSAVNFFGFFNFVFLLDEKDVDHDGPLWSCKRVKWANHNRQASVTKPSTSIQGNCQICVGRGQFITTTLI